MRINIIPQQEKDMIRIVFCGSDEGLNDACVWYKLTNTTGIPGGSEGSLLVEKIMKKSQQKCKVFYTNNNEEYKEIVGINTTLKQD